MLLVFIVFCSCGSGLVVRQTGNWDRTDWYGKRVFILPGLGASGVRFSDPNPNRLVDKQLKKRLPILPGYRESNISYYTITMKILTKKGLWPLFNRTLNRFRNTGSLDTILLQKLGKRLQTAYLILPLYLSTKYSSWEFTGIFSYYSAAVELVLFETDSGTVVFRVRARGYSLGGPEKAFASAGEEVVRRFR